MGRIPKHLDKSIRCAHILDILEPTVAPEAPQSTQGLIFNDFSWIWAPFLIARGSFLSIYHGFGLHFASFWMDFYMGFEHAFANRRNRPTRNAMPKTCREPAKNPPRTCQTHKRSQRHAELKLAYRRTTPAASNRLALKWGTAVFAPHGALGSAVPPPKEGGPTACQDILPFPLPTSCKILAKFRLEPGGACPLLTSAGTTPPPANLTQEYQPDGLWSPKCRIFQIFNRLFADKKSLKISLHCFLMQFWRPFSMKFQDRRNLLFCNQSSARTRIWHPWASFFASKIYLNFMPFLVPLLGPLFLFFFNMMP